MANEDTANYGDILNSTTSILFMGTPHRGSEIPGRASPLTNIVNVATISQGIRRDLLAILKTNSDDLIAIAHQFVGRANSLTIRSFVEMLKDPWLRVLVCFHHLISLRWSVMEERLLVLRAYTCPNMTDRPSVFCDNGPSQGGRFGCQRTSS